MSEPLTPYAGYDVLAKWSTPSWDEQTRQVITRRLTEVPVRRFFNQTEWDTLEEVAARLVPQPERATPIPIAPWIDEKLHHDRGDGFRYDDVPPMRDAWRLGLKGIEEESQRRFGASFRALGSLEQDNVLGAIQQGAVDGGVWTAFRRSASSPPCSSKRSSARITPILRHGTKWGSADRPPREATCGSGSTNAIPGKLTRVGPGVSNDERPRSAARAERPGARRLPERRLGANADVPG
jgi:hypothetical protein